MAKITTLDQEIRVIEESIWDFQDALDRTSIQKERDMIIDGILDLQKEYKAFTGDYFRGRRYCDRNI